MTGDKVSVYVFKILKHAANVSPQGTVTLLQQTLSSVSLRSFWLQTQSALTHTFKHLQCGLCLVTYGGAFVSAGSHLGFSQTQIQNV